MTSDIQIDCYLMMQRKTIPFIKECPSGNSIVHLADSKGSVFDYSPSPTYTADDCKILNDIIIKIANKILTAKQLNVFTRYYVTHQDEPTIAAALGVSPSAVHQSLHGTTKTPNWWKADQTSTTKLPPERYGGSLSKLRNNIKTDPEFIAAVTAIEESHTDLPTQNYRQDILDWYVTVRQPSKAATHYVPLTVLLVIYAAADNQKTLHINDLHQYLPTSAINHSLGTLRILGYISFDGQVITILRTPLDSK